MNELQVFGFEGKNVRVIEKDGNPWWVGRDVCEALGYSNPNNAMTDHCKGIAIRYPLSTQGGIQDIRIISEPDVLRLIVSSKLPSAERFESWVFEEVLPSIRKTGTYSAVEKTSPAISEIKERCILLESAERLASQGFTPAQIVSICGGSPTARPYVRQIKAPMKSGIAALLLKPELSRWHEKLTEDKLAFEYLGMKLVILRDGTEILAVEHKNRNLSTMLGKCYSARLRHDPDYRDTRQIRVRHVQISCLTFDWDAIVEKYATTTRLLIE